MSMTSVEAADFSKKHQKQPTYLIQYKLPNSLIKYTGSFLDARDLSIFGQTGKFALESLQDDMAVRKLVAHVFAAKPEILGEWLSKHEDKAKKILTPTHHHEGYLSTKIVTHQGRFQPDLVLKREKPLFISFRKWRAVSALQAAAFSGDIHFLMKLLRQLLVTDKEIIEKNRLAAVEQLEAVSRRISDQSIILDAVAAIAEIESDHPMAATPTQVAAKLRFEKMKQSEEFQRLITNPTQVGSANPSDMKPKDSRPLGHFQAPTPASAFPSELKTKAESKEASENTKIKYADEAEFLESLLILLKVYINAYIKSHRLYLESKWEKLDKIGEIQGECVKRLPEIFKQVMCDKEFFSISPPPKFDSEPKRDPCRVLDGRERALLDLDSIGLGTGWMLHKGCSPLIPDGSDPDQGRFAEIAKGSMVLGTQPYNLVSFAELYKLQRDRLRNIIESLKTPETAHELIFQGVKTSPKCS